MDVIALRLDILARCVSVPMSGDHLVERKGQDHIVRFDVSCDIFCDCQILEWCPPREPRFDRTEMGPLTEERRPRIRGPGRWSARPRLPSRPREFHPEPLTDSGRDTLASSGSCHRTKAAAFR